MTEVISSGETTEERITEMNTLYDTSFKASEAAYESRSRTDRKRIAETGYILDSGLKKACRY